MNERVSFCYNFNARIEQKIWKFISVLQAKAFQKIILTQNRSFACLTQMFETNQTKESVKIMCISNEFIWFKSNYNCKGKKTIKFEHFLCSRWIDLNWIDMKYIYVWRLMQMRTTGRHHNPVLIHCHNFSALDFWEYNELYDSNMSKSIKFS